MDKNFEAVLSGQRMGYSDLFYLLYGVERVGLASGYKYFGKSDWRRPRGGRRPGTGPESA